MSKISQLLVLCWIYTIATGQQCPPGWEEQTFNGNKICYYFSGIQKTWQSAQNDCEAKGSKYGVTANLVKVDTPAKQAYLQGQLKTKKIEHSWIGAQESSVDWQWVSNGNYMKDQGCYRPETSNDFLPKGTAITTRTACESACSGKTYAAVSYDGISPAIQCQCGNTFAPAYNDVVTGCNNACPGDSTQKCGKSNGMIVSRLGGTSGGVWGFNEPSNFDHYEGCLVFDFAKAYRYSDKTCNKKNYYICEYPNSVPCPGVTIADKCISINTDKLTWYAARYQCSIGGGDLVAVESQALYDEISSSHTFSNTTGRYWTGGISKVWKWKDGNAAMGYSNWFTDEPNSNQEKCAVIYRDNENTQFSWEDQICTNTFSYVCEHRLQSELPTD